MTTGIVDTPNKVSKNADIHVEILKGTTEPAVKDCGRELEQSETDTTE
jgi:hypothetical protein